MTQNDQPQNIQLLAQRAETLRLSGAYEQALEIFQQIQSPDNAWVNAHLGATYHQMMDYENAITYLEKAIAKNDQYPWAHAQLGEVYRLRAIVNNRDLNDINQAIEHFQKALGSDDPQKSEYAWALAHLGATYRLKMTRDINVLKTRIDQRQSQEDPLQPSKGDALKCFNRAIELIPTYAWAWGMRGTIYRLAQEYEDSYWDLEVETVIAPEIGVLQSSPSPVPLLETRRINLYEHALLSFYMTKRTDDQQKKNRHYGRAIAFAQQALNVQPSDLIAHLILTVIEANQKKEKQGGSLSDPNDINSIKEKVGKFFKDAESEFFEPCKTVLRHRISVNQLQVNDLAQIRNEAGEEHKLTQFVLKDVIENPNLGIANDPKLWLSKNFALTEACSNVLFLLSGLSYILKGDPVIGKAQPYRDLATTSNIFYAQERFYQTPVLPEEERSTILTQLSQLTSNLL